VTRYRDDGPFAVLGRLGHGFGLGPLALTLLAAVPVVVVLTLSRETGHAVVVGLALLWFVLLAGAAGGLPHVGRFDWAVPALLRAVEYAVVIELAALRGDGVAAFAFLAAVVYHHYDIVYRVHTVRGELPSWRTVIAGGWSGRLALVYVLDTVGGFHLGLYVAAVVVGVTALAGSALSWREAPA
jgi:hypothetical protein